jgi:1-aminocyclopropane-1-carboxylate deaminase
LSWEHLCSKILVPTPCDYLGKFNGIEVIIKRDDLTHPEISGNKWRKLKYNLKHCIDNKYSGIISFGGAFSNHIYSLSAACDFLKIPLVVIVRGEEVNENNSTLGVLGKRGQIIEKVNRSEYRNREQSVTIKNVLLKYPNHYVINEGGTNEIALLGVSEVVEELNEQDCPFNYLICSAGTGGTAAGLYQALDLSQKLVVYPALKGSWMETEIHKLLKTKQTSEKLHMRNQYHFGGYGKGIQEMNNFINETVKETNLTLDPIYTSKAFFGMMQDISNGFFPFGSSLVFYHSGGLQGSTITK